MKDIKNIKKLIKGAVSKIKSAVEKEDIPLADAYAQMDSELEAAEKAIGDNFFPKDDEDRMSLPEFYLKLLGFKTQDVSFDEVKAHYEALITKYNPENFADDEEKQIKAARKIDMLNKAYQYFEARNTEKE